MAIVEEGRQQPRASKRSRARRLVVTLACGFIPALCLAAAPPSQPAPAYRAGSLAKDGAQAVYAADPDDAWNRIFYVLFTRTVRTRLSNDFPEGKPFGLVRALGFPRLPVSGRSFERIESGDRAIDPLYPSFFSEGPLRALAEPHYSQLRKALEDALHEKTRRPPLARALMQSDLWAAFDLLSRNYDFEGENGRQRLGRRGQLLPLLARLIKKLALSQEEIKGLPDNYPAAAGIHHLPNLFGAGGGWLEIRWFAERAHDLATDYRRVARVFIRPASPPKDTLSFLDSLRQAGDVAIHGLM